MSKAIEHKFLMNGYVEREKAITAFVNSGYTVRIQKEKSDKFKYLYSDYDYYIVITGGE